MSVKRNCGSQGMNQKTWKALDLPRTAQMLARKVKQQEHLSKDLQEGIAATGVLV